RAHLAHVPRPRVERADIASPRPRVRVGHPSPPSAGEHRLSVPTPTPTLRYNPNHDDDGEVVRCADGGIAGAEPLPPLGVLQALRLGRAHPRAGLEPPRPALPADRLVPPDLQRYPHPL